MIYRQLKKLLNGGNVANEVNNKIVENANLIRTLPLYVAKDVTQFVASNTYKGLRSSEIAKELQSKISGYTNARAKLIARTESSKAMTALTEARSRDAGINWYIWRTANDGQRVRDSHANMEGVLVRYDTPPSPEELIRLPSEGHYNAGNIYNCRCFPRPLISYGNLQWPAKVYHNGKIQRMTLEQFKKIENL